MNQENNTTILEKQNITRNGSKTERSVAGVPSTKPIEALLEQLGPKAIFGEPVQVGETTTIPVAEARVGFGFGGGQERSARPDRGREREEGGGSGAGAGARIIPRGYLHIDGAKVRFEPIVDVTRMALAGMALVAWITLIISKARRR